MSEVSPIAGIVILIPYLLALPWIFNKAIAFNARMTSYRNVHFNFQGSYWKALGIFIGLPLLVLVPLLVMSGLSFALFGAATTENETAALMTGIFMMVGFLIAVALIPVVSRAGMNYVGSNSSFGTAKFTTNGRLGAIYGNLGTTIFFTILFVAACFALVAGIMFLMDGTNSDTDVLGQYPLADIGLVAGTVFAVVLVYTPFILGYTFYSAGNRNIAFNNTFLEGGHRFRSAVSRFRYVWIIVSNLVVTIATLFLMRPWAAIRTWRYIVTATSFLPGGSLDQFVDVQAQEGNVAAAEYLDIDGIDFGL